MRGSSNKKQIISNFCNSELTTILEFGIQILKRIKEYCNKLLLERFHIKSEINNINYDELIITQKTTTIL